MKDERRKPDVVEKTGKYFRNIVPIIIILGALFTIVINYSKVEPVCNEVYNKINPKIGEMDKQGAVREEKIDNINQNVLDVKNLMKELLKEKRTDSR